MDTFGYGCGLAGTWVEKVGEVTWFRILIEPPAPFPSALNHAGQD